MKKRCFVILFLLSVQLSTITLHAIEQVNVERIETKKEQLRERIYYMRLSRIAAAISACGLGVYMLLPSASEGALPVAPLTSQEIMAFRQHLYAQHTSASNHAPIASQKNETSLYDSMSRLASGGVSFIKTGFSIGVNVLTFAFVNSISAEVFSYLRPTISSLFYYPGTAEQFYTIHARIPEILNEYTRYAKILTQEHVHDTGDVEYASLYFLHEYDEIIYRVEQLLAYIKLAGEKQPDLSYDCEFLTKRIANKTDQLACTLYTSGSGSCPPDLVEQIESFTTELTSIIRLCKKSF